MADNKAEDVIIFDRASECKRLIGNCINRSIGNVEDFRRLDEQYQRFIRWAGHLGVMAAPQMSLDKRLQVVPDIRDWVMELLDLLKINLDHYLMAKSTPGDFSGDQGMTPDSVDADKILLIRIALGGIQQSIDRLHRLGNIIRKSSTAQLASRVSKFISKQGDEEEFNERITLLLVKGLYPRITEAFSKRLARSISFRRQRLLYQKDRQRVIERPRESIPPSLAFEEEPPKIGEEGLAIAEFQSTDALAHTGKNLLPRSAPAQSVDSAEKASTIDNVQLRKNLEAKTQEVLWKDVQTVTEVTHDSPYPPAPEWSETRNHCQCNWCFEDVEYTKDKDEWISAWRSHFKKDLQPYICISEECSDQLTYFVSVREWRRHMDEIHSPEWTQEIFKNNVWYCSSDQHGFEKFSSPSHLKQHLAKVHQDEYQTEEIEIMISCNVIHKPRGPSECPLCGQDGTIETQNLAVPPNRSSNPVAKPIAQEEKKIRKAVRFQSLTEHADTTARATGEPVPPAPTGISDDLGQPGYESVRHLKLAKHIALHLKSLAFASLRTFDDDPTSHKSAEAGVGAGNLLAASEGNNDHFFELDGSLTFEDNGPQEDEPVASRKTSQPFQPNNIVQHRYERKTSQPFQPNNIVKHRYETIEVLEECLKNFGYKNFRLDDRNRPGIRIQLPNGDKLTEGQVKRIHEAYIQAIRKKTRDESDDEE